MKHKLFVLIFLSIFILTGCKNANQKLDEKIDESDIKIFFKFNTYGNTFDKNNLCYYEKIDFNKYDCYREIPSNDELKIYIINSEDTENVLNVAIENNEVKFDNNELLEDILDDLDIEKKSFEEYLLYYKKTYIDEKQKNIEEDFKSKKLSVREIEKEIEKSSNKISKSYDGTITIESKLGIGNKWIFNEKDNKISYMFKSLFYSDTFIYYDEEKNKMGVKYDDKNLICAYDLSTKENKNCDEETLKEIDGVRLSLELDLQSMHITEEELLTLIKDY